MKGIYVLIIELKKARGIAVGKRGDVLRFRAGFYGYIGSALNGLENRLKRHLRAEKKVNWHIDYLLEKAAIYGIIYAQTTEKKECALAREMSSRLLTIQGFGCSDLNAFIALQQDVPQTFQCFVSPDRSQG